MSEGEKDLADLTEIPVDVFNSTIDNIPRAGLPKFSQNGNTECEYCAHPYEPFEHAKVTVSEDNFVARGANPLPRFPCHDCQRYLRTGSLSPQEDNYRYDPEEIGVFCTRRIGRKSRITELVPDHGFTRACLDLAREIPGTDRFPEDEANYHHEQPYSTPLTPPEKDL